jgi:thymidine kinase
MFSGKSELLIERVRDACRSVPGVAVFKHAADTRFDHQDIVTHSHDRLSAVAVSRSADLLDRAADADVVAIDEAQFFDEQLPDTCRLLAEKGKRVIVAGLDRDSWGLPFGPLPELARLADAVTRTTARCARCGTRADHTQRLTPITESMIGGEGDYEPRCERCFSPPPAELRR